jgi:hypothetical protein
MQNSRDGLGADGMSGLLDADVAAQRGLQLDEGDQRIRPILVHGANASVEAVVLLVMLAIAGLYRAVLVIAPSAQLLC